MSHEAPLELWLVRHAPVTVPVGTCYGRLDVPADESLTQRAAEALGLAWTTPGTPHAPALAWHSPARRTADLARAATLQGLPETRPDARLAEMDFGIWEGQRWDDIPRGELDNWNADFHHHRPGNGENVAELLERVRAALLACRQQALAEGMPRAVWFTHAGVIRAVEVCLSARRLPLQARDWPTTACDFGTWQVRLVK